MFATGFPLLSFGSDIGVASTILLNIIWFFIGFPLVLWGICSCLLRVNKCRKKPNSTPYTYTRLNTDEDVVVFDSKDDYEMIDI
jgi:hypothetical protein